MISQEMRVSQRALDDQCPPVGSRWRHCKGGTYVVTGASVFEEDLDLLVHYDCEETGARCSRRLSSFLSTHPDLGVKRFTMIE